MDLQSKEFDPALLQAVYRTGEAIPVDSFKVYAMLFGRFPSTIALDKMNVPQAITWVKEQYGADLRADWQFRKVKKKNSRTEVSDCIMVLSEDILIYFISNWRIIRILYNGHAESEAFRLEEEFRTQFTLKEKLGEIRLYLIQSEFDGLKTHPYRLKPQTLDLDLNYNDDLLTTHHKIIQTIRDDESAGVVLLYGKPGTGKTTYIRHLISQTKRPVTYLPSDLAHNLGNPSMMRIWSELPNSICIIEDAELVLSDRSKNPGSPVASLLNLTDGFLAQCFHILFICTFNVPLSEIDPALTRKGRLLAGYEFKELKKKKAQALSDHLGFNTRIENDMTLVDIFHQKTESFNGVKGRKEIGFKTAEN